MSKLDDDYLRYPLMRQGMDHSRYSFASLRSRWANQPSNSSQLGRLAIVIVVCVQEFPLNPKSTPRAPGSMVTAYPDLRHKSLRDYGLRVGIYRVLEALQQRGIRAGFAVNSDVLVRAPGLLPQLAKAGEIIAHGVNMDHSFSGAGERDTELNSIQQCASRLRAASVQAVEGWLSPGKSQSWMTESLLLESGFRYCLDWVNDELPYHHQVEGGSLLAFPLSSELEDRFVIQHNLHSEQSWQEQILDAAHFLAAESLRVQQMRMLTLTLHPWLIGQPHRIGYLESVLDQLAMISGGFFATPSEFLHRCGL